MIALQVLAALVIYGLAVFLVIVAHDWLWYRRHGLPFGYLPGKGLSDG